MKVVAGFLLVFAIGAEAVTSGAEVMGYESDTKTLWLKVTQYTTDRELAVELKTGGTITSATSVACSATSWDATDSKYVTLEDAASVAYTSGVVTTDFKCVFTADHKGTSVLYKLVGVTIAVGGPFAVTVSDLDTNTGNDGVLTGLGFQVATGIADVATRGCDCEEVKFVTLHGTENLLRVKFQCDQVVPAAGKVHFDFVDSANTKKRTTALTGRDAYFGQTDAPKNDDTGKVTANVAYAEVSSTLFFRRITYTTAATDLTVKTADTSTYFFYHTNDIDVKKDAELRIKSNVSGSHWGKACTAPALNDVATGGGVRNIGGLSVVTAMVAVFFA